MTRLAKAVAYQLVVLVGAALFVGAGLVAYFAPTLYPLGEPAQCDRAGYRLEETLGGGITCGAKIPKVNKKGPPEYCHLWLPARVQPRGCEKVAPN